MRTAESTILAELKFTWSILFILGRRIVTPLARGTGKRDDISHGTSSAVYLAHAPIQTINQYLTLTR
jgi:hypothetical protein